MPVQVGDQLAAYRLDAEIGQGAFGQVFRAVAESDAEVPKGTIVALKVLHHLHKREEKIVHRFHREARLATKLSHPHVVKILGEGVNRGEHYIVMELAEGESLTEYLKKVGIAPPETKTTTKRKVDHEKQEDDTAGSHGTHGKDEKSDQETDDRPILNLPIPEAVEIMRQVAGVLQAAHEIGLVHRDIKPDNVFVSKDTVGNIQTKVLDFGLAKDLIAQSLSLSSMGHSVGTPPFMSPEQFEGAGVDIRSDLYSLGATAYEMLTGRAPFPGPTLTAYMKQHQEEIPLAPCKLNPNLPLNLSQVVERLLAKRPEDRHQRPAELAEDLNRVERGEVPLKLYKPKKPRRHSLAYTIGAVAAGILLTIGLVAGWLHYRGKSAGEEISRAVAQARYLSNQARYDEALNALNAVITAHQSDAPELLSDARKLREGIRARREADAQVRAEAAHTLEAEADSLLKSGEYDRALALYESAAAQASSEALTQKIESARRFRKEVEEKARAQQAAADARAAAEQRRQEEERQRQRDYRAAINQSEQYLAVEDNVDQSLAAAQRALDLARTPEEEVPAKALIDRAQEAMKARREWAAVVDFTVDESVRDKSVTGRAVAVKLEQSLSTRYRLVTRTQIGKALEELKFSLSDLADRNKAQKFGKMVGARWIVTGSVIQLGQTMTIATQIFSVETGAIRQTAEVEARSADDFNALFPDVARVLPMTNEEKQKYLDEQLNYPKWLAEGKDLIQRAQWADAVQALEKAQRAKRTAEVDALLAQAREKAEAERIVADRKAQYEAALAEGNRLLQEQKWTEAEAAFRKALAVLGYARDSTAQEGIKTAQGGAEALANKRAYEDALRDLQAAYAKARNTKDRVLWQNVKTLADRAVGTGHSELSEAQKLRAEAVKHIDLTPPANWSGTDRNVTVATPQREVTRSITYYRNTLGMEFVKVPAGEFMMGDTLSPEEVDKKWPGGRIDWYECARPRHNVKLTRDFYMASTEVTRGQFDRFVREISYRTEAERGNGAEVVKQKAGTTRWEGTRDPAANWRNPLFEQTDAHPVVCVSWNDAKAFCDWLSKKEGATYRLPTEAEWEYAARAGSETTWYWGDEEDGAQGRANVAGESEAIDWDCKFKGVRDGYSYTAPVSQLTPNAFGLYDMIGNANEWCQNWFDSYPGGEVVDPQGPDAGQSRMIRGGSWYSLPGHCRSAARDGGVPALQRHAVGFRVVCDGAR